MVHTRKNVKTISYGDPLQPPTRVENTVVLDTVAGMPPRLSQVAFNGNTRLTTYTSPAGRVWSQLADADGRVLELRAPGQVPTVFSYIAQASATRPPRVDRVSRTKPGSLRLTTFSNYAGRVPQTITSRVSSSRQTSVTLVPDADGFPLEVGTTGRTPVLMAPDESLNATSVAPPARAAHEFGYDARGLNVSYAKPGSTVTEDPALCPVGSQCVTYNADRKPSALRLSGGTTVAYDWQSDGLLHGVSVPGTGDTTLGYDARGRVTSAQAADGAAMGWAYQASLPIRTSWSGTHVVSDGPTTIWSGTLDGHIKSFYTGFSELRTLQVLGGYSAQYERDLDGLTTSISDGAGGTVPTLSITRRSVDGSIESTAVGNVATSDDYDISASTPGYGDLVGLGASVGGSSRFQTGYQRDDLGRIAVLTETMEGSTRERRYEYDDDGRLTHVRDGSNVVVASYQYDENGNRTQATVGGTTRTAACPDTRATNDLDQLCSYGASDYTYDGNGALSLVSSPVGDTHYRYDGLGRLTKVILADDRVIHYVNDAMGRRIGKVVDGQLVKGWLYADGLRPIAQLNGAGQLEATYVYGTRANVPDLIVEQVGSSQVTYRVVSDHLGTPRLVIRVSDGVVVHRLTVDEFGLPVAESGPRQDLHPFGFAGGLWDRDTGLVRFGARDYDPETGRWTARDPILFEGGQSNLYAYVNNDPVNLTDPEGLFLPVIGAAVCAFGGCEALGAAAGYTAALLASGLAGGAAAEYRDEIAGAWHDLINYATKADSPFWQGLEPYRGQTKTNGLQGKKRRFYEWDHTHGDIEEYDRNGQHLGSCDAETGERTKGPKPGREIKK